MRALFLSLAALALAMFGGGLVAASGAGAAALPFEHAWSAPAPLVAPLGASFAAFEPPVVATQPAPALQGSESCTNE